MMHGRTTDFLSDCLGRAHGPAVRLFYAFTLFLLLAVDSWADCVAGSYDIYISKVEDATQGSCPSGAYQVGASCSMYAGKTLNDKVEQGGYVYTKFVWSEWYSRMNNELCRGSGMTSRYCLGGNIKMNNTYSATFRCGDMCSADSLDCPENMWVHTQDTCYCRYCEGAECCEEGQIYWPPTDECLDSCATKTCCDSLNRNKPPKIDTTWVGCIDDGTGACNTLPDYDHSGDYDQGAICWGKSEYQICTTEWIWSNTTKDCRPLETRNCISMTQFDERCDSILCTITSRTSIGGTTYNKQTRCYEVETKTVKYMECSNGIRDTYSDGAWTTQKLCDSYLDSIGMDFNTYMGGGGGGAPPSVAGGGGDPGGSGCIGNGCNGGWDNALDGGDSYDAEGNLVTNMPSPHGGGFNSNQSEIVIERDSSGNPFLDTAGNVIIVKNSSGGDSTTVSSSYSDVRCIGVSGGVATLKQGDYTFTCAADNCSQAYLRYKLGSCGSGVTQETTGPDVNFNSQVNGTRDTSEYIRGEQLTIDYSSILNTINQNVNNMYYSWMTSGEYRTYSEGVGAVVASVNAASYKDSIRDHNESNHVDSLWKLTFGNDLTVMKRMLDSISELKTSIASDMSAASAAISQAADRITSANSSALSAAASAVTGAVSGVRTTLRDTVHNTNIIIERGISVTSQAISANSAQVVSAVGGVTGAVNSVSSRLGDSLGRLHGTVESIFWALDTGGIVNLDLNGIRSSVDGLPRSLDSAFTVSMDAWYNDKLKVTMDSNAQKVVDALDALNVDVKLDSIKIDLPRDTLIDSIYNSLRPNGPWSFDTSVDSVNLGQIMQTVYDSTVGDTSFVRDSSFSEHMRSVAQNTIDGGDVSDTEVDSLSATLSAKFDSSQARMNRRSDTTVAAYKDTLVKYYGTDSIGNALNSFFSGYDGGCPRNCLDIKLTHAVMTGGKEMTIGLSKYLCDMQIVGNYSILDFLKLILRVMTAWLCMILLLSAVPLGRGKK